MMMAEYVQPDSTMFFRRSCPDTSLKIRNEEQKRAADYMEPGCVSPTPAAPTK